MRVTLKWILHICALYFLTSFEVNAQTQEKFISSAISLMLLDESRLEKTLSAYTNPNSGHIFIAAHRGGREFDVINQAPGNSIKNITNALNNQFDQYESDIEILGDGTLVVFHDDHFNDLTNSIVANDLLDNADLSYAKGLFLTYTNGAVSNERIPTLYEFLTAIKGKMMVKFDLKSGTFSSTVIQAILDTVVTTGTTEQVLIRAGLSALDVAKNNGYDTRMMMPRYNSAPTLLDINNLISNYSIRAISIPNLSNLNLEITQAASAAGIIVEVHESQGVSQTQLEIDWQHAIDLGIKQFHSFKPSLLKAYLIENGYRAF